MNIAVAYCVGCGCDDLHACHPSGCSWLRIARDARIGVCSSCDFLVRAWDAGACRSALTTREGVEVRAGQRWRDLDKRTRRQTAENVWEDRVLVVERVAVIELRDKARGIAHMRRPDGQISRIRVDRMRKSSTGYALLDEGTSRAAAKS